MNKKGISGAVDELESVLTTIDQEITELLTQRNGLAEMHANLVRMYHVLMGEDLRTPAEMGLIGSGPGGSPEEYRQAVLSIADQIAEVTNIVPDTNIIHALESRYGKNAIPWKNPKAVIATILTRSGRWERVEQGKYTRVKDDDDV